MTNDDTHGESIGATLRDLFDTIVELETSEHTTETHRVGRADIGHGSSIRTVQSALDGESSRSTDGRRVDDTEYATAIRESDEGIVVTVDLPAVDTERLAAGVDETSATLAIGIDDRVLTRVALPRGDLIVTDAAFNNGILELSLRATEGDR